MATFWAKVQFWCNCVPSRAQVWIKKLFIKLILPKNSNINNVKWFVLNNIQNFCQHLSHKLSFSVSVCPVGHGDRKKQLFLDLFCQKLKMKHLIWFDRPFSTLNFIILSICQVVVCLCALSGTEMKKKKILLLIFFSTAWN